MEHAVPPPAPTPPILVSIVVPTYNEAEDIRRTLDSLVGQTYPYKEVIVVDDSTDATPRIVGEYARQGVRLVRPVQNRGRSGARNLGIRLSQGDIVVILNADVFPQRDFLERIVKHYEAGADYVLVESRVANDGYLFPRYMETLHRMTYARADWIEWTEGYSCRRDAAVDVGLFPEDLPIPLSAGEDAHFGLRMARKYRKVIDRSIVVPHMMPHTLAGFWSQHRGRGRGMPLYRVLLEGGPVPAVAARVALRTLVWIAGFLLVLPGLVVAVRLCRHSPRGWKDMPGFWLAWHVNHLALLAGEWVGLRDVWRVRRGRSHDAP